MIYLAENIPENGIEALFCCFHPSLSTVSKMKFHALFLAVAVDPALGKIDKSSLPTQTLMEIFIEGIENKEIICGSTEEPTDVDEWEGFKYSDEHPNEDTEKPFSINWNELDLVGSIDLQWLPSTVSSLQAARNKLGCFLNLTTLPDSIQRLNLSNNVFSGEIDLCHLLADLKELNLTRNQLSGSLHLENLPQSMQSLYVHVNRFSGTVCLRHLPLNLIEVSLASNNLSGPLDLTRLPINMKFLWLGKNNFEGETDFSGLPRSLQLLAVSYTNLSGQILAQNRTTRFYVEHSNVEVIE